jgi:hypothetical protein
MSRYRYPCRAYFGVAPIRCEPHITIQTSSPYFLTADALSRRRGAWLRHGRRSPDTATLGRLLALTERGLIELDAAVAKRDREHGDVSYDRFSLTRTSSTGREPPQYYARENVRFDISIAQSSRSGIGQIRSLTPLGRMSEVGPQAAKPAGYQASDFD